jgi:hypothetical protein
MVYMTPGHAPEAEIEAGLTKLETIGLGHLADVQVSFGGVCVGGLAQLFGKETHVGRTDTADVEQALLNPITAFVDRDPQNEGDYVRINGEEREVFEAVRSARSDASPVADAKKK